MELEKGRNEIEKVRVDFDFAKIKSAQGRTWETLRKIANAIEPGMREEDGVSLANLMLKEAGAEKFWHRSYVRFGVNSTLPYGVNSTPDVRLGENDIFFLDLGPVFDGYEGDAGETFVVGNDPELGAAARDCKILYGIVADRWRTGSTGEELYRFAEEEADEMGWELNVRKSGGHRVSEFPHAAHFRGNLAGRDFCPSPGVWILEIQLRSRTRKIGAFYEDLLV